MKDFIWFLVVGSYVLLIYVAVAHVSWAVFDFISDDVLHIILTIAGVLFFHKKLIFRGTL